jgi:hypothetical protein
VRIPNEKFDVAVTDGSVAWMGSTRSGDSSPVGARFLLREASEEGVFASPSNRIPDLNSGDSGDTRRK